MFDFLKNLILQYAMIDESEIKETSRLRTDLGLTSFDIVNMAEDISSQFGVTIADEDIPSLKTVGDYLNLIQNS